MEEVGSFDKKRTDPRINIRADFGQVTSVEEEWRDNKEEEEKNYCKTENINICQCYGWNSIAKAGRAGEGRRGEEERG